MLCFALLGLGLGGVGVLCNQAMLLLCQPFFTCGYPFSSTILLSDVFQLDRGSSVCYRVLCLLCCVLVVCSKMKVCVQWRGGHGWGHQQACSSKTTQAECFRIRTLLDLDRTVLMAEKVQFGAQPGGILRTARGLHFANRTFGARGHPDTQEVFHSRFSRLIPLVFAGIHMGLASKQRFHNVLREPTRLSDMTKRTDMLVL